MGDQQAMYLETFPAWLRTLGDDAEKLGALLAEADLSTAARQAIAGGLNYLFKSLDLIPDGIDDIGYLDDAFVLRVAAELAAREDLSKLSSEHKHDLERIAGETDLVKEFLGREYGRLEAYTIGLKRGSARGRTVDEVVGNQATRNDFLSDVRGFAKTYQAPSFTREEKTLIKLRAFFDAKLPK